MKARIQERRLPHLAAARTLLREPDPLDDPLLQQPALPQVQLRQFPLRPRLRIDVGRNLHRSASSATDISEIMYVPLLPSIYVLGFEMFGTAQAGPHHEQNKTNTI